MKKLRFYRKLRVAWLRRQDFHVWGFRSILVSMLWGFLPALIILFDKNEDGIVMIMIATWIYFLPEFVGLLVLGNALATKTRNDRKILLQIWWTIALTTLGVIGTSCLTIENDMYLLALPLLIGTIGCICKKNLRGDGAILGLLFLFQAAFIWLLIVTISC